MHVDACGDLPSDVATSVAMDKDRFDAVCGACDAVADALIDDEGKPSLEVFKRVMDKGPISDLLVPVPGVVNVLEDTAV